ncbi:MAG: aminotransferase class V-fold PLP-dependent enzyme [Clostridia bacterium]|nr:aminotransferase class V-fold PLP-dependent enzyme [Clostridia bacterium]
METPICDFIDSYVKRGTVRLHMPGHKGKTFIGAEKYDVTEIRGADVLSCPKGIIAKSEKNAAATFGAAQTVYSTEGSTASIKAMLYLACAYAKETGKNEVILAARNVHKAFCDAAALLGFGIKWLYDEGGDLLSYSLTAQTLEKKLSSMPVLPVAVYVTSPDYLGCVMDIKAFSAVCKKFGVLLLVDNAHGAYLKFLEEDIHPMTLGADMCVDSAHKTLPCLTGGSYLHIKNGVNEVIGGYLDTARSLFYSTSPSWPILYSLDKLNSYLAGDYGERLNRYVLHIDKLKAFLSGSGYDLKGSEKLKVTLCPKSYGYTGEEISDILYNSGVEVEFADKDHVVMMFTPENGTKAVFTLKKVLAKIEKKKPISAAAPGLSPRKGVLSPRQAVLSLSEEIAVNDAIGRVFASSAVACPPAVPLIVAGEEIDENAVGLFKYYGVEKCRVVKK